MALPRKKRQRQLSKESERPRAHRVSNKTQNLGSKETGGTADGKDHMISTVREKEGLISRDNMGTAY